MLQLLNICLIGKVIMGHQQENNLDLARSGGEEGEPRHELDNDSMFKMDRVMAVGHREIRDENKSRGKNKNRQDVKNLL